MLSREFYKKYQILSEPTIVESMCMSCGENGVTRLLLTKIPHYKVMVVAMVNYLDNHW